MLTENGKDAVPLQGGLLVSHGFGERECVSEPVTWFLGCSDMMAGLLIGNGKVKLAWQQLFSHGGVKAPEVHAALIIRLALSLVRWEFGGF